MRNIYTILVATMLALISGLGIAHDNMVGTIMIERPWARASAGTVANGAAYLTVSNAGTTPDRIVLASTPVAKKAELHIHTVENSVMKMRQVEAIDIGPGASVELKPSGLHVMLIGLNGPLVESMRFPLTLTFEKAGKITIEVVIESAGATEPAHEGHHTH